MDILVETDSRKRISLAKLGVEESRYYLADCRPDGSILLRPAEVRPKVMDVIDRAIPNWRETVATETDVKPSPLWEQVRDDYIAEHPDVIDPTEGPEQDD